MKHLVALVGMQFRKTEAFVASLPAGEPLTLARERGNAYDRYAVQVHARGRMVGFLKMGERMNKPIAVMLDDMVNRGLSAIGYPAKLVVDGGRWPMVEIDDEAARQPPAAPQRKPEDDIG